MELFNCVQTNKPWQYKNVSYSINNNTYLIYKYKPDLALNHPQGLICQKSLQTNPTTT